MVKSRLARQLLSLGNVLSLVFLSFGLVVVCDAHAGEATLGWNPNPQSEDVVGYTIYRGYSSGAYNYSVYVGNQTEYTMSGLTAGQTYYCAVTATDVDDDESAYSEEVWFTIPGDDPPPMTVETGEVSVNQTWKWVGYDRSFQDPIVVAKSLSSNDGAPAVVRIRNVDSSGFEIRVQEWDYLDGSHMDETIGYLVMERGTHTLPDGTMVEAGRFQTNQTGSFGQVAFSGTFPEVPVVITSVSSNNETDAVTTRVRNVSSNGFELRMQEQEDNSQTHATETISYIAWEPSSGTVGGVTYEVEKTGDVVTDAWHTIVYNQTFTNIPVFVADMQTADGTDPASVRWQGKDLNAVDVTVAEEQSKDSETTHATEVVGYMLFTW
jgi:hypothetical protein